MALRQGVLIGPVAIGLLVPVIALLAIPMLGLTLPVSLSSRAEGGVIFGAIGYFLSLFGASLALASRPMVWLIPAWLAQNSEGEVYAPPRPTSLDRLIGGLGMLSLLIGALCLLFSAIEFIRSI